MSKRFRDTLWFKKGVLDAQAAEQTAADTDALGPVTADTLPVEDRYLDDGSLTREDSQMFTLRTGRTQGLPRLAAEVVSPGDGLELIVKQMTRGRHAALAMIGVAAAACAVVIAIVV